MLVALFVVALLMLAGQLACIAAAVYVYRRLATNIRTFTSPSDEGALSPLAQITHALGQDFARAIVLQIKQQIAQPMTAMQRQENAMQMDATAEAIEGAGGGWGALLGLLPKNVQKRVLSNPSAAAALIGLLGRGGLGGGGGGASNGGRSSVQERLKKLG